MRRRRSRMRWVCATAAPWALGAGLLVSFTASAGHDLPPVRGARLPSAVGALLDTPAIPASSGTAADAQLLFNTEEGAFPASRLTPGPIGAEAESGPSFVPSQSPDPTTTRQATSAPSPAAAASGATTGAIIRTAEGTTPPVSRAVALSSTTPAPP